MLERATIGITGVFSSEAARRRALESVQKGNLHPEYLVKHFGTASLLDLNRDFTHHFLGSYVQNDAFRQLFLSDLGFIPRKDRQRFLITPVPAIISWLPAVEEALQIELEYWNSRMFERDTSGETGWKTVQRFFSRFTYPEATPNLLDALGNTITFPETVLDHKAKPLSERVVGTMKLTQEQKTEIPGGYQNVSAHLFSVTVEEYEAERVERIYRAYRPVAEGASDALMKIADRYPQYAEKIYLAVIAAHYGNSIVSQFVPGKEIPGTRHPIRGYYAD